jgi:hypothetical protein
MLAGRIMSLSVALPSWTVHDNDEDLVDRSGIEDGRSTSQDQASSSPRLYVDNYSRR